MIELVEFNTRSTVDSEVLDDDDNVDLEKSNVLLMGPTGSGMTFIDSFIFFFSCKMRINCVRIACSFILTFEITVCVLC